MTKINHIEIEGKRFVILPELDYDRLKSVDDSLPPLPPPDEDGYIPAFEMIQASIARGIILKRRAAGLSQVDLAKLAGVRQETISRVESSRHKPNVRTLEKIEAAFIKAAGRRRRAG
ncbi:MAG: helix-turn-helix transcriptional regulator [Phycisphaerales bacterium]